jgi:hypothetical protein
MLVRVHFLRVYGNREKKQCDQEKEGFHRQLLLCLELERRFVGGNYFADINAAKAFAARTIASNENKKESGGHQKKHSRN